MENFFSGDFDLQNGKVDGNTLSFGQTTNFNGTEFKITHSGKADGDTIRFTRQSGDRPAQDGCHSCREKSVKNVVASGSVRRNSLLRRHGFHP
jgi:hypothetical protein